MLDPENKTLLHTEGYTEGDLHLPRFNFSMQAHTCLRTASCGRRFFYLGIALGILLILVPILSKYNVVFMERPSLNAPERSRPFSTGKTQEKGTGYFVDEKKLFSFIPAGLKNCRVLFKNGSNANLNFSSDYFTHKRGFDTLLNRLLKGKRIPEGHVGSQYEQSLAYSLWASASFVRTICETGFNAGHSALVFLTANPDVHVYSFDFGAYGYSKQMANYLHKVFPGRLHVTWGNSINTVPAFVKANPDFKCDIISIDGGHKYKPCKADLRNLRALAREKYHLLYIDDYPVVSHMSPGVAKAWGEELARGQVKEHFKCAFEPGRHRGFTVGKYIDI